MAATHIAWKRVLSVTPHSVDGHASLLGCLSMIRSRSAFQSPPSSIRFSRLLHVSCTRNSEIKDIGEFDPARIRNFSIIAHIDHGKSTLADRLLEQTGTIKKSKDNKQVMDRLQVERERGITVKAQTATVYTKQRDQTYMLNLIDTPGHVDFGYEVRSSLAACEGVLLLVDATQGIQAQTLANFYLAFERNLTIIPVINKVDLPHAEVERVTNELVNAFDIDPDEIIQVSAKTGVGIDDVLTAIVDRVPPPPVESDVAFKALLFDSWFDSFRGVINLVQVKGGSLRKGQKITMASTGRSYDVAEVGILNPLQLETTALHGGQVGYVVSGMRQNKEARVGDTIHITNKPVDVLPGFKPARCMVFCGLYPVSQEDLEILAVAVEKLCINDPSVSLRKELSPALGSGFRLGFLGMLHMDVFAQRLSQEYAVETIVTAPSVSYKVIYRADKREEIVDNPADFPTVPPRDYQIQEPMVIGTLVFPEQYLGKLITLCQERRGVQKSLDYLDADRVVMVYRLPLNEIVEDFFDAVKGATSGYATFDYEEDGYETADIVKLTIALNGDPVDALSTITHNSRAYERGKEICTRLKGSIKRQLYDVAIQASSKTRIIARETIKAMRKDVTAKCYGGDVSRKKKLLNKQKEGKKKMRMIGTVEVPKDAFLAIMKR
eukprot:m.337148 g.337148  ORF g.337148 m.337148 type:complete len:664 (+) comp20544_c0_seq1:163-2154(+)